MCSARHYRRQPSGDKPLAPSPAPSRGAPELARGRSVSRVDGIWIESDVMACRYANVPGGSLNRRLNRRSTPRTALVVAALWAVAAAAQPPTEEPSPSTAAAPDDRAAGRNTEAGPAEDLLSLPGSDEEQIVTRFEARLAFDRLVAQKQWTAAVGVGEKMVALTEKEFGPNSDQAAEAHAALADAQSQAGAYDTAEENYLRTVAIYRETDGLYSEQLIEPLLGLGDNYQRNDQYVNAIAAYDEARTVSRRAFGLLNEGQIEILDRMTQTYRDMNEYAKADERQQEALRIVERSYAEASPEVLQAIYKYAHWLRESGRFSEERTEYGRAEKIIRDNYGEDSVQMAKPLQEIGNSYRSQRNPQSEGIDSLQEALTILESHTGTDPLTTASVLRDIGDWEVAFSNEDIGGSAYLRAWKLLGDVTDGDALRQEWFTGLAYVLREPISQRGLSPDPKAVAGHVLVRFDVDRNGRTQNAAIIESDPPGMKDDDVLTHIKGSRFRPHIADGAIVRGDRLALQFNFRYLPDEDKDTDAD